MEPSTIAMVTSPEEFVKNLEKYPVEVHEKPYGITKTYKISDYFEIAVLDIEPNQRLSRKRHVDRDEFVLLLDDMYIELYDEDPVMHKRGDIVIVPRNIYHRMSTGDKSGRMLKIEFGGGAGDMDDFIRSEDDYDRPLNVKYPGME